MQWNIAVGPLKMKIIIKADTIPNLRNHTYASSPNGLTALEDYLDGDLPTQ